MQTNNYRLLITGATGELGKPLVDRLKEAGYQLTVLSRRDINPVDSQIRFVRGDLLDVESLQKALDQIDIVIHLAAVTHTRTDQEYWRVNAQGTANLIKASQGKNIQQFIFLSSRAVGKEGGAYCHSKLMAEEHVKASGLNWVILRPAEVYGNAGKDQIAKLVETLKSKKFIPVLSGDYTLCPVHVDDVISALLQTINNRRSHGKIYTLAGPEKFSFTQLIHLIERMINKKCRIIYVPVFLAKWAVKILSLFNLSSIVPDQIDRLLLAKSSDSSEALHDLNFRPRALREGFSWPK